MATLVFSDTETLKLQPSHLRSLPLLAELVANAPTDEKAAASDGGQIGGVSRRKNEILIDMRGMPVSLPEFLVLFNRVARNPIYTPNEEREECEKLGILSLDTMEISRETLREMRLLGARVVAPCKVDVLSAGADSSPAPPVPGPSSAGRTDTGAAREVATQEVSGLRSIYELLDYFKVEDPGIVDPKAVLWQDFEGRVDPKTGLIDLHEEGGESILSDVPFSGYAQNSSFPDDCLVLRSQFDPPAREGGGRHRDDVSPAAGMYVQLDAASTILAETVAPCRESNARPLGDPPEPLLPNREQEEQERRELGKLFFDLLAQWNETNELGARWVLVGGSVLQALCGVFPLEDLDFFLIWPPTARHQHQNRSGEQVAEIAVRGFHSILQNLDARIALIQRSATAVGFQVKKRGHMRYRWRRTERGKLFSGFRGARKYVDSRFERESYHGEETLAVQLVVGYFDSVEYLLNAFDLGSSRVAFDGGRFYTTVPGLMTLSSCANIVNVNNTGASYVYRLAK